LKREREREKHQNKTEPRKSHSTPVGSLSPFPLSQNNMASELEDAEIYQDSSEEEMEEVERSEPNDSFEFPEVDGEGESDAMDDLKPQRKQKKISYGSYKTMGTVFFFCCYFSCTSCIIPLHFPFFSIPTNFCAQVFARNSSWVSIARDTKIPLPFSAKPFL
jgi:hypothetical protein